MQNETVAFAWGDRRVTLFEGETDAPLVLMHENQDEGAAIRTMLEEMGASCTLAGISGIDWEKDLSPWPAPAAYKKGKPFTGGADAYMQELTEDLIPELEKRLQRKFDEIYLAGYSLAGLFALYCAEKTNLFSGFVSASGSLWYPGLPEYAAAHFASKKIKKAYFSLGDREAKTRNALMQPVEENTRALEKLLKEQGIKTVFVLNRGGHFDEPDRRLAEGIRWILGL